MKIAYLVHWAEQPNSGVIAKIRAQTKCWHLKGNQVAIFMIVPEENRKSIRNEFANTATVFIYPYRSTTSRIVVTLSAVRAIIEWDPDAAYCRQMTYHPSFSYLAYKIPTIIEVNTNDARELDLRSWFGRLYGKTTRRLRYAFSRGLVCVTQELADASEFTVFNKPTTVIANGIDLGAYRTLPSPHNDAPHLIFLGSKGQSWHGIDKIVQLAKELPDWTFHLVGPDQSDLGPDPGNNLILYGHVDKEAYLSVMAKSDAAIGTLALHRKGMNEACPLKVREYLASGLPVITGYNDTDFPCDVPFILRLPNIESNIDASLIEDFVCRWKMARIDRNDIQELDIISKEESRLRFLESAVA